MPRRVKVKFFFPAVAKPSMSGVRQSNRYAFRTVVSFETPSMLKSRNPEKHLAHRLHWERFSAGPRPTGTPNGFVLQHGRAPDGSVSIAGDHGVHRAACDECRITGFRRGWCIMGGVGAAEWKRRCQLGLPGIMADRPSLKNLFKPYACRTEVVHGFDLMHARTS